MFLDHTQRRTIIGRTPLDEWSARRRDLYLTTHDTHNRQIFMPPVGFEPTISAGERPQAARLLRSWVILLTRRKWWTPNNASKQQMGFNSAFKGLIDSLIVHPPCWSLQNISRRYSTPFIPSSHSNYKHTSITNFISLTTRWSFNIVPSSRAVLTAKLRIGSKFHDWPSGALLGCNSAVSR